VREGDIIVYIQKILMLAYNFIIKLFTVWHPNFVQRRSNLNFQKMWNQGLNRVRRHWHTFCISLCISAVVQTMAVFSAIPCKACARGVQSVQLHTLQKRVPTLHWWFTLMVDETLFNYLKLIIESWYNLFCIILYINIYNI
jgi:hypothetical protein